VEARQRRRSRRLLGLFDADRQDKGVLAGPVTNVPYWPLWLVVGG
jgi:hypothetical protein